MLAQLLPKKNIRFAAILANDNYSTDSAVHTTALEGHSYKDFTNMQI
jgi:hypothetical protein